MLNFLVFASCSIESETDPNMVMKMVSKVNTEEVSKHTNARNLVDPVVNIKLKLAIMWTVLIFFYLYNDVISFFKAETVEGVLTGAPNGIEVTSAFLLAGAVLMSIPIFMVYLSISLPAKTNRPLNIVLGIFHLVVLAATFTAGDEGPDAHYALYMAFEGLIIALITWTAWKWPAEDDVSAHATSPSPSIS